MPSAAERIDGGTVLIREWEEREHRVTVTPEGKYELDGQTFRTDSWTRPAGGGGLTRLIEDGNFFERGGCNFSHVMGEGLPPSATAARPELAAPLTVVAAALEHPEPAARIQQLCGAVTAKAIEDRLFYRDPTLVSLNEVGGEPHRFGVSAAEFHHRAAVRAARWPTTMTALTTHDTKRGEDVRARIGVLSQVPGLWSRLVADWQALCPPPDAGTGLFLWQNMFGVWPMSGQTGSCSRMGARSMPSRQTPTRSAARPGT
mgnify:CR=1 FL=1